MSLAIDVAGLHIHWAVLLLAIAVVQWLVFALMSAFSRTALPNDGLRSSERNLIISTTVLAIAFLVTFGGPLFSSSSTATQASAVASSSSGHDSCASIQVGMTDKEVQSHLGKADEVRNDDKIRGPNTSTWIYRDSRCAVHLLDNKVEVVD